jgi:hypothetical protein
MFGDTFTRVIVFCSFVVLGALVIKQWCDIKRLQKELQRRQENHNERSLSQ